METTDYLTEPQLAQVVAGTMSNTNRGNPDVPLKLATALKTFQTMSEHIFYSVEEEAGGYLVKDRIGPTKKFPTFKSAVEFAQRSGLPGGSVQSVWNWRRDPKKFTQDQRMRNLRQALQELSLIHI